MSTEGHRPWHAVALSGRPAAWATSDKQVNEVPLTPNQTNNWHGERLPQPLDLAFSRDPTATKLSKLLLKPSASVA